MSVNTLACLSWVDFFYNLDLSWEKNRWFTTFLLGCGLVRMSWGFCSQFALETCTMDSACWITLLLIARLRVFLDKKDSWHFLRVVDTLQWPTFCLFCLYVKNHFFHLSPQFHFSSVLMKQSHQFHYNFVYIEENEKKRLKMYFMEKTWRLILMFWETPK